MPSSGIVLLNSIDGTGGEARGMSVAGWGLQQHQWHKIVLDIERAHHKSAKLDLRLLSPTGAVSNDLCP